MAHVAVWVRSLVFWYGARPCLGQIFGLLIWRTSLFRSGLWPPDMAHVALWVISLISWYGARRTLGQVFGLLIWRTSLFGSGLWPIDMAHVALWVISLVSWYGARRCLGQVFGYVRPERVNDETDVTKYALRFLLLLISFRSLIGRLSCRNLIWHWLLSASVQLSHGSLFLFYYLPSQFALNLVFWNRIITNRTHFETV